MVSFEYYSHKDTTHPWGLVRSGMNDEGMNDEGVVFVAKSGSIFVGEVARVFFGGLHYFFQRQVYE